MNPRQALKTMIQGPDILRVPACYDALSARLIERAGFPAAFMGGFAVSAVRLGMPDTGLISYGEMVAQGRDICSAVSIPDRPYRTPSQTKIVSIHRWLTVSPATSNGKIPTGLPLKTSLYKTFTNP